MVYYLNSNKIALMNRISSNQPCIDMPGFHSDRALREPVKWNC